MDHNAAQSRERNIEGDKELRDRDSDPISVSAERITSNTGAAGQGSPSDSMVTFARGSGCPEHTSPSLSPLEFKDKGPLDPSNSMSSEHDGSIMTPVNLTDEKSPLSGKPSNALVNKSMTKRLPEILKTMMHKMTSSSTSSVR